MRYLPAIVSPTESTSLGVSIMYAASCRISSRPQADTKSLSQVSMELQHQLRSHIHFGVGRMKVGGVETPPRRDARRCAAFPTLHRLPPRTKKSTMGCNRSAT